MLCSVDVAVFIFGNNKKLYEYSSSDMRDLVNRYQYVSAALSEFGPISTRPFIIYMYTERQAKEDSVGQSCLLTHLCSMAFPMNTKALETLAVETKMTMTMTVTGHPLEGMTASSIK